MARLPSHRCVQPNVLRQAEISDGYLKIASCNCRRTGTVRLPRVKPVRLTEYSYRRQHLTKCSHGKPTGHLASCCSSVEGNEQTLSEKTEKTRMCPGVFQKILVEVPAYIVLLCFGLNLAQSLGRGCRELPHHEMCLFNLYGALLAPWGFLWMRESGPAEQMKGEGCSEQKVP